MIKKIYNDTLNMVVSPRAYFSSMVLEGGMTYPLVKVVLYALFGSLFAILPKFFYTGSTLPFFGLIIAPIVGIIGLFIGTCVAIIISSLAKGNSEFEPNLRVVASLFFISAIGSILSAIFMFVWMIPLVFDLIIEIAFLIYGIYLTYTAFTHALSANKNTIKVILGILGSVVILVAIISITVVNFVAPIMHTQKGYDVKKAAKNWEKILNIETMIKKKTDRYKTKPKPQALSKPLVKKETPVEVILNSIKSLVDQRMKENLKGTDTIY
ncbi:YIP1 family protein [Elusimicrobiota bacterium]